MGVLDLLFPKYCINCRKINDFICTDCFSYITFDVACVCLVCNRASFDGLTHPGCKGRYRIDGAFSIISYNHIAKKLIYNFKYRNYVSSLKKILADLFYEGMIQNENIVRIMNNYPHLIPIPLHASKMRRRGYNQSELLAKEIGKKMGSVYSNELLRIKNTKSQFGLSRRERVKNMSGAFKSRPDCGKVVKGKSVFLIDDVLASGSTLMEAANVLKRAGAHKVYGLTFAKS